MIYQNAINEKPAAYTVGFLAPPTGIRTFTQMALQFGEAFDWHLLKIQKNLTVANATVRFFGTPNGNRTHN